MPYYQRKKAENKVKTVSDMTERQKRKQRKSWRKNLKTIDRKKKTLANILSNSPPDSANEIESDNRLSRKRSGRKLVKKDKAQAYRTAKKQKDKIQKMQRIIDKLRKYREKAEKEYPKRMLIRLLAKLMN